MTLYEKIQKIQYDNKLTASEFLDKTRFSSTLYYAIKDGTKTELKPLHARILCDKFGISDSEWFLNNPKKELKKDNYINDKSEKDYSKLSDEYVEIEFIKRYSRLRNRELIKRVIGGEIEVEVSKRLIKLSQSGELKKWLSD